MKSLGEELGWPKNKFPPSTYWVAEQVEERRFYDYLFAASSRFVHFSAGEAFRNTWWSEDALLRSDKGRQNHEYAFALDCQIQIMVKTFMAAFDILKEDLSDQDVPPDESDAVMAAVERYAKIGRVPMITPEEFNLRRMTDEGK